MSKARGRHVQTVKGRGIVGGNVIPLFDVIAVNLKDRSERFLAERKSKPDAEAIVEMAVIRRGVDDEYFKLVPHPHTLKVNPRGQTLPEYTLLLVAMGLVLLLAGRPITAAVIHAQQATRVTALVSHRACSDNSMKDCWEVKP
jgi:hypothetical protein